MAERVRRIKFNTANGNTTSDSAVKFNIEALSECALVRILESTQEYCRWDRCIRLRLPLGIRTGPDLDLTCAVTNSLPLVSGFLGKEKPSWGLVSCCGDISLPSQAEGPTQLRYSRRGYRRTTLQGIVTAPLFATFTPTIWYPLAIRSFSAGI